MHRKVRKLVNASLEQKWLKQCMRKITTSENDISYRSILHNLYGFEKFHTSEDKCKVLIASDIADTEASATIMTPEVHNDSTGEDKDNPIFDDFEGQSWQKNGEHWRPPPQPPDKSIQINKLNDSDSKEPTLAQTDSGANRIVTNDISLLKNVTFIDPIPMGGCNKNDEAAITCNAVGYISLRATCGTLLTAKAYYSDEVDGTIISPTTIIRHNNQNFGAWMQYSSVDDNAGHIELIGKHGQKNLIFNTVSDNDLWFHDPESLVVDNFSPSNPTPKIRKLSAAAKYELWHQRLGHPGINTMADIHKHVDGIPQLRGNPFYRCPSCMAGKLCNKQPIGKSKKTRTKPTPKSIPPTTIQSTVDDIHLPQATPGQHFHMDFGFVRGSNFNYKTNTGKTVTSIDGKNAYLAIIDRSS